MRSTLLALLIVAALLTTSLSVAAQSIETDVTADDSPISDQPPADQDSPEATPTPAVVYVVITATPAPTAAPTDTPVTYTTRNGLRSEQDVRNELAQVGYQGPWDLGALLTAYDRATAPTATPLPTSTPTPAPTRVVLDPVLMTRCAQFTIDFLAASATYVRPGFDFSGLFVGLQDGCRSAATARGALGENCYEFAVTRWFQANLNAAGGVSASTIDALYHVCLGGS